MQALAVKWLPDQPHTAETLGQAYWLEHSYWENMQAAVQAAICNAFKS